MAGQARARRLLVTFATAIALSVGARAQEPAPAEPVAGTDPAAPGETLVPWDQASQYIGREVTITGKIVDVHCSPLNCLLAFEPTFNRFTAVIPVNRFDVFPPDQLKANWVGRQVRVFGTVIENSKKPEIIVQSADALRISRGERRRERDQRRQDEIDAQADALDRLDVALARVEELTTRLAASEERLEQLLAVLDQKLALLATLPAGTATALPEPVERPSWEALRSIKRGMAARDVVRLIGEPVAVEAGPNGWEIWHYGHGRSISIDRRGRVTSFSGFTAP